PARPPSGRRAWRRRRTSGGGRCRGRGAWGARDSGRRGRPGGGAGGGGGEPGRGAGGAGGRGGRGAGDGRRAGALGRHPAGEGAHAAQHQPVVERRGDRAEDVAQVVDALPELVAAGEDEGAPLDVAVAAEVLGRRVED